MGFVSSTNLHRLLFLFITGGVAVAAACSSSDSGSSPAPGTDAGADVTPIPPNPPGDAGTDSSTPPSLVTFSYTPSWKGVQTVEVLGAFGQGNDWTTPFVTLVDDGTGTFKGTSSVALAPGKYPYVFHAIGDEAAGPPVAKANKLVHYAIDPAVSAFEPCPADSPTYAKTEMNPCSDLTVPQGAAEPKFHARGVVQSGGAPIGGYLVVIERIETGAHHMFADRTTTAADGTFDLAVASGGTFRFQVLHPTYYSMTDAQRTSPETYAAVRRSISSSVLMNADVAVDPAEVAYGGYAAMEPRGASTLPTTFSFTVPAGTKARAQVYGPTANIGDPWWVGTLGTDSTDVFDGGGLTSKAPDGGLKPDASYFWGTEQAYAKGAGGTVSWTAESMVFPVQWQ